MVVSRSQKLIAILVQDFANCSTYLGYWKVNQLLLAQYSELKLQNILGAFLTISQTKQEI